MALQRPGMRIVVRTKETTTFELSDSNHHSIHPKCVTCIDTKTLFMLDSFPCQKQRTQCSSSPPPSKETFCPKTPKHLRLLTVFPSQKQKAVKCKISSTSESTPRPCGGGSLSHQSLQRHAIPCHAPLPSLSHTLSCLILFADA